GLHPDREFAPVPQTAFSPPTETRTWFHQGPVLDASGQWNEGSFADEFWPGDRPGPAFEQALRSALEALDIAVLDLSARREALRALKGLTLRTELYALDGSARQDRPYSVSETYPTVREILPGPRCVPHVPPQP